MRSFSRTSTIRNVKFFSSSSNAHEPERAKKTSLFDFHVSREGKIVNFAGYLLPVQVSVYLKTLFLNGLQIWLIFQYADQGIVQSHLHTRAKGCASIFDVRELIIL